MAAWNKKPVYLKTAEVAARLDVSPKTISRWAKEGKIPHKKTLGGHRRYPDYAVDRLELEQQAGGQIDTEVS